MTGIEYQAVRTPLLESIHVGASIVAGDIAYNAPGTETETGLKESGQADSCMFVTYEVHKAFADGSEDVYDVQVMVKRSRQGKREAA